MKVTKEEYENERKLYSRLSKENRCKEYARSGHIPNSYKENTLKEELILEHVIQYKKEFGLTYDPTRDLLLYPMNECGKYKFICTTIRPTKVPYPELYDYEKCAKFISEYIEYQELNPVWELPKYIPGPDNVMKWQIGDSFDMSIVLCSLLIGAGYNAFVVYGIAPRFITTRDETRMSPPDLADDIKIIEPDLEDKGDGITATIEDKLVIESEFDKKENEEKEAMRKEQEIKDTVIDDDEPELDQNDPYMHRRVHAWILLRRNKRLPKKDIFIECSTGRIYDIKTSPYEKVEAILNNFNFYINLNSNKTVDELDWNLNNASNWEYVMLGHRGNDDEITDDQPDDNPPSNNFTSTSNVLNHVSSTSARMPISTGNITNLIQSASPNEEENKLEELDMPPSWVNKITIPLFAYNNRTPTSTQTFYYEKTKVEKFAPFSQPDGLVMKIFRFKDYARFLVNEVEYRYRNRGDKLYKRVKYPYEHKTVDYFLPGQPWHWKIVEEVEASYKKVTFYPTNFEHCIVYREEIFGEKIVHRYNSRDDRVFERKVLLNKNSQEKQLPSYKHSINSPLYDSKILITKFTQKIHPNPLLPPDTQIFKLSYKFDKGTHIQVINHYGQGKILSKPENFSFEDETSLMNEDKDDINNKIDDDKEIWKKQIYTKKSDYIGDFNKIEDYFNHKYQESLIYYRKISENRFIPVENNKNLYERGNDLPILEKNLFDIDLSNNDLDKKNKIDYSGDKQRFDRLQYFLQLQKEKMEKNEDRERIKDEIIKIFKEEKTDVTNILQQLLKEQVTALQNEMESFKNKDVYVKEEIDKHNEAINEIQRKINIIYQRSHRHITKIMEDLNILLGSLDN